MTDTTEKERVQEAIEEMRNLDRLRTMQSCCGGCLKWTLILFGIVDLFFVNIAMGLLLYKNLGL